MNPSFFRDDRERSARGRGGGRGRAGRSRFLGLESGEIEEFDKDTGRSAILDAAIAEFLPQYAARDDDDQQPKETQQETVSV